MKLFAALKTRFVVWVWNHTPTCAEMSRLTSRALEQPLTLRMRLKMRLHFVICAGTRQGWDCRWRSCLEEDCPPRQGSALETGSGQVDRDRRSTPQTRDRKIGDRKIGILFLRPKLLAVRFGHRKRPTCG